MWRSSDADSPNILLGADLIGSVRVSSKWRLVGALRCVATPSGELRGREHLWRGPLLDLSVLLAPSVALWERADSAVRAFLGVRLGVLRSAECMLRLDCRGGYVGPAAGISMQHVVLGLLLHFGVEAGWAGGEVPNTNRLGIRFGDVLFDGSWLAMSIGIGGPR